MVVAPINKRIGSQTSSLCALNNNEPFPGERLLHRLLDKSYYAHILPPLPEVEGPGRDAAEGELGRLLGKGREAWGAIGDWLEHVRGNLTARRD